MILILKSSDETFEEYNLLQTLLHVIINRHMHPGVEMDELEAKVAIVEIKSAMEEMSH